LVTATELTSKIAEHKIWLETQGNCGARLEIFEGIFEELKLVDVDLFDAVLTGTTFKNCIITKTNLNKSNLASITFENCDLSESTFNKSNLDYAFFYNCNLHKISFFKSTLYEAKFVKTKIDCADMQMAYTIGMTIS